VREHAHGERRLKYPMKLEGRQVEAHRLGDAINEIGDQMLKIREQRSGLGLLARLGQAQQRAGLPVPQVRRLLGHQQRRPPGADLPLHHGRRRCQHLGLRRDDQLLQRHPQLKAIFIIGGNPAEAHPVSLLHVLKAKEQNNAPLIVCDPRFTRTAAHADEYVRFRPGTDVALSGAFSGTSSRTAGRTRSSSHQRVWGMDQIKAEVAKWTPDEVERVTGVPGSQLKRVASTMANNRPGTLIWCMGGTQHTNGNNNTRAYCILQLALGNMGTSGGGTNIFRGHDNVQGATDLGVLSHTLPGYYGLSEGRLEALGARLGRRLRLAEGPVRHHDEKMQGKPDRPMMNQGHPGLALDRRRAGRQGEHRPAGQRPRHGLWGHAPNSRPAARR
jgi:formate dehydrogenase major subunit